MHLDCEQLLLTQSLLTLQTAPGRHFMQVGPPQSIPVSLPLLTPSPQDGGKQIPLLQILLVQSSATRQLELS